MKYFALTAFLSITLLFGCSKHHDEMPAVEGPVADVIATEDNQPIRVEVGSSGYSPKNIGVTKGQTITLEFHRQDEDNCGEKVVFPDLKLERDLPVGEKVLIEITAEKSGEIKFTCGMDMFRGRLLVTE
jgi:plastocyanin domain-containing protein